MQIDLLLGRYDELSSDVAGSTRSFLQSNLKRWFRFLDSSYPFAGIILQQIEPAAVFQTWFEKYEDGNLDSIDWPEEDASRLALQLALFRKFASSEIDPGEFALIVLGSGPNIQIGISEIVSQIFVPLSKDLRRFLVDRSRDVVLSETVIPAANRIVTLDHNSAEYESVVENLNQLVTAVEGSNEYDDGVEKQQHIAELSAGRALLGAIRVRVEAIVAVLRRPLTWLAEKFAGGLIGQLAAYAWHHLAHLLGLLI